MNVVEATYDWFWTKRNSVWFQNNQKIVNKIWFRLIYPEIIRRRFLSVSPTRGIISDCAWEQTYLSYEEYKLFEHKFSK